MTPPPQPAAASILAGSSTPFAPQPWAPGGTPGAKPLIEPKAHPVQFLGWQRLRQPPHCRLSLGEVGAECLLDLGVGAPGRCRFTVLGSAQSLGSFNNGDIPTKQVDSAQGGACAARFLAPGPLAHVFWLFLGFEADGAGFDAGAGPRDDAPQRDRRVRI